MFTASRSIVAAAALALCAPAWASSSGSFHTGAIRFQLIDLRPDDGIAPSLTFQTLPDQEGGVAAQAAQLSPLQLELRAQYGSWADSRIASATTLAKARARVQGGGSDGGLGGAKMSGNGAAKDFFGPPEAASGFFAQSVLSSSGEGIRFTLSPWTALVVTMDASVKLATTKTGDAAESSVVLSVTLDNLGEHRDEFQFNCSDPCNLAEARALSVSIQNESDTVAGGQWWAMGTAEGTAVSTAAATAVRPGEATARATRKLRLMLGATGLTKWQKAAR
ncbi:hypothetical protein [Ideonella sp. YS5]|uniref:hypothetical protein n=1 Tax=Ideonella sp. YS5 TaxID=3453714 RepID=UPI003EE9F448